MDASPQRRVLDRAIDDSGPTPCSETPERWFPRTEAGVSRAEEACLGCAVFAPCGALADALQDDKGRLQGVWGGVLRGDREDQLSTPRPSRAARTDDTEECSE